MQTWQHGFENARLPGIFLLLGDLDPILPPPAEFSLHVPTLIFSGGSTEEDGKKLCPVTRSSCYVSICSFRRSYASVINARILLSMYPIRQCSIFAYSLTVTQWSVKQPSSSFCTCQHPCTSIYGNTATFGDFGLRNASRPDYLACVMAKHDRVTDTYECMGGQQPCFTRYLPWG